MFKFTWVTLRVSDIDKSLTFYRDILGMPMSEDASHDAMQIAMMGTDNGPRIELLSKGSEVIDNPGQGVTYGLSVENVDELAYKLMVAGVAVRGPYSPTPGFKFYFTQDPDGYTIQLVGKKLDDE